MLVTALEPLKITKHVNFSIRAFKLLLFANYSTRAFKNDSVLITPVETLQIT